MKKIIFPVVLMVGFYFGARLANPELEGIGMLLSAFIGMALGVGLNSFIFKKKA